RDRDRLVAHRPCARELLPGLLLDFFRALRGADWDAGGILAQLFADRLLYVFAVERVGAAAARRRPRRCARKPDRKAQGPAHRAEGYRPPDYESVARYSRTASGMPFITTGPSSSSRRSWTRPSTSSRTGSDSRTSPGPATSTMRDARFTS